MKLNMNHLRIFYVCGKNKTFTESAKSLYLSIPAVTVQLKQLEANIGLELFHRHRKTIELTETGLTLFEYAKKIFDLTELAENKLEEIRTLKTGELRIGTLLIYARHMMSPLISAYQERYPGVHVVLDEGSSTEIIRSLLDRRNDLGLICASPPVDPQLIAIPHFQEELVLIMSNSHPLAKKRVISLKDIAQEPLIIQQKGSLAREFILNKYREANIEPHILTEAKNYAFIIEQVEAGKGISFWVEWSLSDHLKRGKLKIRRLSEAPFLMNVGIVYLKDRILSPPSKAFINLMVERKNAIIAKRPNVSK